MPTRAERTALIFVSAVVLAGGLVRVTRALRHGAKPPPAASEALARQRQAVDSAVANARPSSRGGRPARSSAPPKDTGAGRGAPAGVAGTDPAPRFPIDVDHASAHELEALPRIGATLAARIVAEREAKGPFGSLDSLRARVKGIGPAIVKVLQPVVVFSGR